MHTDAEDEGQYKVVVNDEDQYSIWPVEKPLPGGWHDTQKSGSRTECLAYIADTWTDMRPLTVRRQLDALRAEETP